MGTQITLTASDGFKLGGYRARAAGKAEGRPGGDPGDFRRQSSHPRLCDRFAALGYVAVAPAVFDRIQPNFECGYTPDEIAHARTLIPKIDWAAMMRDTAGRDRQREGRRQGRHRRLLHGRHRRVPRRRQARRAVGGDRLLRRADRQERRPEAEGADAQLHFGDQDQSIPMSDVEMIKQKRSGLRDPRLSRRPRLQLRRARQLRRGGATRQALGAHARLARQARRDETRCRLGLAQNQRSATMTVSPGRTCVRDRT